MELGWVSVLLISDLRSLLGLVVRLGETNFLLVLIVQLMATV
jgi:hypothetical protein